MFLWRDPPQRLDAGEGAPNDVLEAGFVTLEEEVGIFAGHGAAGTDQTTR